MVCCLLTLDTKIKAHNALNAMFVETVNTLVFVALTQHLIQSTMRCENYSTLYKVASCPCQEGRLFVETVNTSFIQYSKCSTQNREKTGICQHCQDVCASNSTSSMPDELSSCLECSTQTRAKYWYMSTLSIHAACSKIRSHPNSLHCICQHCQYRYNQITM